MWCCMYPSFFRFKRLVEDRHEIENNNDDINNNNNNGLSDTASITNNLEEFKTLFKTHEKACYELQSENTVLKMKLEMANEMIHIQSKKIKSLKLKKNKLEIENNIYKNVLYSSSFSLDSHKKNISMKNEDQEQIILQQQHNPTHNPIHAYAYPPPLPLPPPANTQLIQNKKKMDGNPLMNSVLDELKSRIKK